ncbi:MAG: DUF3368 domain-containing protein [Dehalococcoidia bacterium]
MPAISNSSPLIRFARAERLELLRELFGSIVVPPAVWEEVVVTGAGLPDAEAVAMAGWIERADLPTPLPRIRALERLGLGEAETIWLALQRSTTEPVLLDDYAARREALRRALNVRGSAGVLLMAKAGGLIPAVKPELDRLRSVGLYLSPMIEQTILQRAGEGRA